MSKPAAFTVTFVPNEEDTSIIMEGYRALRLGDVMENFKVLWLHMAEARKKNHSITLGEFMDKFEKGGANG